MKLEHKYHNWNEVSISLWKKMDEVCNRELDSDIEKNIALLALICDCNEDDLYNLSINDLNNEIGKLGWINRFEYNSDRFPHKLKINGQTYRINPNLQDFTISQYVDFQTFWPKVQKKQYQYMGNLLAVFLVPEGKKYNEGYDAVELAKQLEDNVSIATYNSVLAFFLTLSAASIEVSALYLDWTTRKMEKKAKDPETKELLEVARRKLRTLLSAGTVS